MNMRTLAATTCALLLLSPLATLAAGDAPAAEAKPKKVVAENCPETTGSRIRANKSGPCRVSAHLLRTYSSDDLQSTGAINLTEALARLDPRFR